MNIFAEWWAKFVAHKTRQNEQAVRDVKELLGQEELNKKVDVDTEEYKLNDSTPLPPEIEEEVDAKVEAQIGKGGYMGYCYRFWACKKRILREEYGIEWQSPAETNSGVCFD